MTPLPPLTHDPSMLAELAMLSVTPAPVPEPEPESDSKKKKLVPYGLLQIDDTANVARFKARWGDVARYVPHRKCWLMWRKDKGVWEFDEQESAITMTYAVTDEVADLVEKSTCTDKVRDEARKKVAAMRNTAKMQSLMTLARAECAIDPREIDNEKHIWLLNLANGVYNLQTGEFIEHSSGKTREFFFTKQIPIKYDPSARCEQWEKFLESAFQGDTETIAYLQKCIGYSLSGSVDEEVCFYAYGPAGSGKGTLEATIDMLLGSYATKSKFETFLAKKWGGQNANSHSEDIARLRGARVALANEGDRNLKFDEPKLKELTGKNKVTARNLFEKSIEFLPQFKLWFFSNFSANVDEDSEETLNAIWRRLKVFHLNNPIPDDKQDASLKAYLMDPEQAGPGILNWALEGFRAWKADGAGSLKRTVSTGVKDAIEKFKMDANPLKDFFDSRIEFRDNYRVSNTILYEAYKSWARDNGKHSIMPEVNFGRSFTGMAKALSKLKPAKFGEEFGKSEAANGTRFRLNVGVKIRDEDSDSIFLNEKYIVHPSAKVAVEDLYPSYLERIKGQSSGLKAQIQTRAMFHERMAYKRFEIREINGRQFYIGIGVRTTELEAQLAPPKAAQDPQHKLTLVEPPDHFTEPIPARDVDVPPKHG